METPIIGIFLLLLTVVAMFMGTVGVIHALLKQKHALKQAILIGAAIWIAAYLLILISVSALSHGRVLGRGAVKPFCGFYLDCHLRAAVEGVDTVQTIAATPRPLAASGAWWIVTV